MSRLRLRSDQVAILDDVPTYCPIVKSRVIECDRKLGLPSGIVRMRAALGTAAQSVTDREGPGNGN